MAARFEQVKSPGPRKATGKVCAWVRRGRVCARTPARCASQQKGLVAVPVLATRGLASRLQQSKRGAQIEKARVRIVLIR